MTENTTSVMSNQNTIPHGTLRYVSSTELFSSLPSSLVNKMWRHCPYTFGDSAFSMIRPMWVKDWIEEIFDEEDNETVNNFFERLTDLHKQMIYIDLEG